MSSALSLSLFGLLLCVALGLANPLDRMEEVTEDTEGSLQPLDEIVGDDYIIKQQYDINEFTPDREVPMTYEWEGHTEDLDKILGDSEELGNDVDAEENPSESGHALVKRDVEEEEDDDDVEVAEDAEQILEEADDEEEHEVEKREVNEGLLQWYREAIETNST